MAATAARLAKNGVRPLSITQARGDDPMSNMIRQIMALFDERATRIELRGLLADWSLPGPRIARPDDGLRRNPPLRRMANCGFAFTRLGVGS